MQKYFVDQPRDFLAVATPGAGKTTFALTVAAELLGRRLVDRVTIVAPTEHLKVQWAEAAARAGIPIDPTYAAGKGRTSKDYVGIAVTYAGVAVNPLAMRIRTENFKTLVILDEVHHAGDALSWGGGGRGGAVPSLVTLARVVAHLFPDLLALRADRELLRGAAGDPHLAAQGDDRGAHDHGLGQLVLVDEVGEALVVPLIGRDGTSVLPDVSVCRESDGGHGRPV